METYTKQEPRATTALTSGHVPGVRALVEALTARDGLAYVGARYFGSYADAAMERARYAERLRRDALRGVPRAATEIRALLDYTAVRAALATGCPWCGGEVGEGGVTLGGRTLHALCADQAMDAIYGEPTMAEMGVGTDVDAAGVREAA